MNASAVLWIRVSSEPQAHGYSPEAQEELLKKAAEKYEVVQTFRVTESAKTSEKRRRFKEMVELVKANKIGYIFAYSTDRLTRNYKDMATLHSLIDDYNVAITLVGEGKTISKQSTGGDRFVFQVLGANAEMQNRDRAEATLGKMDFKARHGGVPRKAPTGYLQRVDPEDPFGRRKLLWVDPVRGPLVTQAFELYAQGTYSLSTLAEEMNRRGLTTRPSPNRPGRSMTIPNMQKILKNPFYYGEHWWRGQLFKGNYEPLITRELFNRVQVLLADHRAYIRPAAKKWFAFKPFLKCGYCGCSITAENQTGKSGGGLFTYYHCTSGKRGTDLNWYQNKFGTDYCLQKRWTEEEIDELISNALGKLYLDDYISTKIREQLKTAHFEEEAFEKKENRRLETEITRKKNNQNLLYQDRLDGTITKEQYLEKRVDIQRDLDLFQTRRDRLARHNVKYKEQGSEIIELLRGFKQVYLAADLKGKSEILSVMLREVNLKGEETQFLWHEPFASLFHIGQFIRKNLREW